MKNFTRRDLLKMMPAVVFGSLMAHFPGLSPEPHSIGSHPNVIIIVFDSLSARHLQLHGYRRATAPNISRFAEGATVYHNHQSSANFTSPGVASLLTGTYPWTHRAFGQAGEIRRALVDQNLFRLAGDSHRKIAFTHNMWANVLLDQFGKSIDVHLPSSDFAVIANLPSASGLLANDPVVAFRAYEDFLFQDLGIPASPYLGFFNRLSTLADYERKYPAYEEMYPAGIPYLGKYKLYFQLDKAVDGAANVMARQTGPFLGYFHFYPPHDPYYPRAQFSSLFDDGLTPVAKPIHALSAQLPDDLLNRLRRVYDQYVADLDDDFGRLMDQLAAVGLRDNSYVILTSDHGQMFERGVHGHVTPLLYQPVIHIPLIVSAPGQQSRRDIHAFTSSVDLLPTLLHILGMPQRDGLDGIVLPGFAERYPDDRAVFALEAKQNAVNSPLNRATVAMIQRGFKLISYLGYPQYADAYELYDLSNDPEELLDLSRTQPDIFSSMKRELQCKLEEVNAPYLPKRG